ncbi:hypothetical protein [Martelella endophytica]|uniref:hypothetical protein n=1 Tax=Martelella endophytica TaxID=1486262 RepID=UPI000A6E20B5|nr:hypothetical protein [Martelella endophytica]
MDARVKPEHDAIEKTALSALAPKTPLPPVRKNTTYSSLATIFQIHAELTAAALPLD